ADPLRGQVRRRREGRHLAPGVDARVRPTGDGEPDALVYDAFERRGQLTLHGPDRRVALRSPAAEPGPVVREQQTRHPRRWNGLCHRARLRRALDQLDPGHWRSVTLARTQLQDPRVATLAFLEPGSDVVEQRCHDVAIGDLLQHLPPRGEIPPLRLRDQALRVGPKLPGFGFGRRDALMDEQLLRQRGEHEPLVRRTGAQPRTLLRGRHAASLLPEAQPELLELELDLVD